MTAEESGREKEGPLSEQRSPVRRIEDSVAALDALEEEIEMVGGLIPKLDEIELLAKPEKPLKRSTTPHDPEDTRAIQSTSRRGQAVTAKTTPTAAKSKASNAPQATQLSSRGKSWSEYPYKTMARPARNSSIEAGLQPSHRPRVSSVHKAPFQPAKSTKAPTKPSFELPGEAVSRRLKEQREERNAKEAKEAKEAEEPKKHVFKARPNPLRNSQAPEVKLTAATKARLSMAKGGTISRTSSVHEALKAKSMASTGPAVSKRNSSITIPKRSSIAPLANTTAHRVPSLSQPTTNRTSISSNTHAAPPVTSSDLAHQKLKGKEVFNRPKAQIEEREKAKKEKEEAARKARAEAAERGRVASREWAERMKMRKVSAQKV